MKLIITAGGTRERIDSVRTITNDATGRLGSQVAKEISLRLSDKDHTIYYLCGMDSAVPEIPDENLKIIRIEGTDQLMHEIKHLLITQNIYAVIHSMAVSDYKVSSVTNLEQAAQAMLQKFHEGFDQSSCKEWQTALEEVIKEKSLNSQYKISSDLEQPLLLLEKTPKIISIIKETSPGTILVGFKLLSNVSREQLIETAYGLLERNRCDFVLANDTGEISEAGHVGYLIDKTGSYQTFKGKKQIAKGIADKILAQYSEGVL